MPNIYNINISEREFTAMQERATAFVLQRAFKDNKRFSKVEDIIKDKSTKDGLEKIFRSGNNQIFKFNLPVQSKTPEDIRAADKKWLERRGRKIAQNIKDKKPVKSRQDYGEVKEDKAFDNVVGVLRKKYGKDAVLTKDSPKPKAQPRPKAKPDTRTPEQKKKDQDHANVMARYGGEANYKAGRGLGT